MIRMAADDPTPPSPPSVRPLETVVCLDRSAVAVSADPKGAASATDRPVLVLLAAGRGTRFGEEPKPIQPVRGLPLARHTIRAFREHCDGSVLCVVGHRGDAVRLGLGDDIGYVESANPVGGTAFATYEALAVDGLLSANPPLIIAMGDRIATATILSALWRTHTQDGREADLTLLTAEYRPPRNRGKGRILRDACGSIQRILEQRDIEALADPAERERLESLTEGNCPLYLVRARTLLRHARGLTNANAQGQYYLTDLVERIAAAGGLVRSLTITPAHPEYELLCTDVTRAEDLGRLESLLPASPDAVSAAAGTIRAGRPAGQVAAIAAQLRELVEATRGFRDELPVAVGIAGGRLRIAFMHPDMGRFFGPAWQMPIGAKDAAGREQIVVLAQPGDDGAIRLFPLNPAYREAKDCVPADHPCMYPGPDVADPYDYELFGTRLAETLLVSLGYVAEAELTRLRATGRPLPPATRWVRANMRRPFSLVGNAIASLRTRRAGAAGARVQEALGPARFRGLVLATSGAIPPGGFASSSAVTVATKNALNALYGLGLTPDEIVSLACQAEYGTGVRAGSLDQATEQKGRAGEGSLISSNPKDQYRVLATHPVPVDRIRVLFPYTVDRDREAWRWSAGFYGDGASADRPTTGEIRKLTGKAAELAAILTRLPLRVDLFQEIESELLTTGRLGPESRRRVCAFLRSLPLLVSREELERRIAAQGAWYAQALAEAEGHSMAAARDKSDRTITALFADWREPVLHGIRGIPLRAMVAYLYGEVATNFHLIHHPDEWIATVSRSQQGDRCFDIDPDRLPDREEMLAELAWEAGREGPALLEAWLTRVGATPFDYNCGLDDETLSRSDPAELPRWKGTTFFRGLALIDLVEAMLKRAFGSEAVALRVNAAGQGDFFQVHVDTRRADPEEIKHFIRRAVYARFGLRPPLDFVEPHPGGGALGLRLDRFDRLPALIARLSQVEPEGGN
jgi:hypothetical protein